MKHFIAICLICIFVFAVLPMAFASEVDSNEEIPQMDLERMGLVSETMVSSSESIIETSVSSEVELIPLDIQDVKALAASGQAEVQSTISPVTPNNTNGLKKIMVQLIGDYDPVVVEYSYQSSQGYTSYLREIEPDYAWLCSCAIFLIILYSIFRIFGMVIQWRQ